MFQVDAGEVVIVVRRPGSGRPTELVRCGPGSVLPLLPGSWHLTYVWRGPAVVTNAYSVTPEHADPAGKYFTRGPVRCGLRRDLSGVVVFRDGSAPAQDRGEPVWRVAAERLGPGLPPLEDVFAGDPEGTLLSLLEDSCARLDRRIA